VFDAKCLIMQQNLIQEKSFEFALMSVGLYKALLQNKEFVLSKQFFRSATSIGANVTEASASYSKKDFAAKMAIASKEARETLYWLRLIEASQFIEYDFKLIKEHCESLIRILTAIVKTAQASLKSNE
jgi:four helix bundle protein